MKTRKLHRWLSAILAGAVLLSGCPPIASAAGGEVSAKLKLSLPEDGAAQDTAYIQALFNQSVLGYGAVKESDATSNVEGPNKL